MVVRLFVAVLICCYCVTDACCSSGRELTKVTVNAIKFWVENVTSGSDITAKKDRLPVLPLFPVNPGSHPNDGFWHLGDRNETSRLDEDNKGIGEKIPTNWIFEHVLGYFLNPSFDSKLNNKNMMIAKKAKEQDDEGSKDVRKRSFQEIFEDKVMPPRKTKRTQGVLFHILSKHKRVFSQEDGSNKTTDTLRPENGYRWRRRVRRSRVKRIVGGSHCAVDTWPWMVSVQYLGIDGNWHHFCSGSLIDSLWVVTVAHCVAELDDLFVRIVLGDFQLSFASHHEQGVNPSKIYMHSFYNVGGTDYDIAMIKLSRPAVMTSHVQTISMATKTEFVNQHITCYIAGWGNTIGSTDMLLYADYLQESAMSLISKSECRHYYDNTITDMHACVKGDHSSACLGDSGGPLVCARDSGSWALVGLASWVGSATCAPGIPNVYTRVGSLLDWITAVMTNF